MKKLDRYEEKRRFDETPEPVAKEARSSFAKENGGFFVIQKHRATRLHYDVRLELDGVLISWAVPKGPSLDPKERRLAVKVEDHPLEYQDFEGVIPEGNYGAGEVIVWDRGTWEWTPTPGKVKAKNAAEAHARGKLDFTVKSAKLAGRFVVVRTADEKTWLLKKVQDAFARPGSDVTEERPESVVTGRKIEELKGAAPGEHQWSSKKGLVVPEQRGAVDLDALLGPDVKLARRAKISSGVEPMLPTLVDELPKGEWLAELKLDGVRALAIKQGSEVRLVSRGGNDVARTFPEIARAAARLPVDVVLDVEICVLDSEGRSRFQLIQPRLQVAGEQAIERLAREQPAVAYAFDLLHAGSRSLEKVPLETRKRVLEALLPKEDDRLRYLTHIAGQVQEFFELACERGVEGIVLKRPGSRYEPGRTRTWLKVKCVKTGLFAIGGYTLHAKTKKGALAGLLLGVPKDGALLYTGGVGTGFDEKTRRELRAKLASLETEESPFSSPVPKRERAEEHVFVRPELVAEVRYTELTGDLKLRHPSFVGLRDVDPRRL